MKLIKVKVFPQSKEEDIVVKSSDTYVVRVKEKAENGMANQRVRQILSVYFRVVPGKIRLVKGGRKPNKIFGILE